MNNSYNLTKVITGVNTRWRYCNVWELKSINGGTPKYSVSLIIPKSDTVTIEKIKKAIEVAYKEGESKLKGTGKSVPALQAIKTPLRDGDLERPDDEAYKGCYFINANSPKAPGIVDAALQPILERSEVYSGVYGRASINLYAFNSNGNKGIACGLNNLQKIKDGESLGGKSRAENDFVPSDEDDFLEKEDKKMVNVLSTIFCVIVGIEFITLLFLFVLSTLFSLSSDVNAEKRRAKQEKRNEEYHKARMKEFMK